VVVFSGSDRRVRASRYPESIRRLVRALVREAIRLEFHGRARVDTDGRFFVITLRVRDVDPFGGRNVFDEMSDREKKRRAREERG
jgi:hypothetical protein